MKKMKFWGIVLPVLLGMIVSSCESSLDDQLSQGKKSGTLTVKITDAPFPSDSVAEANITIDKVVAKLAGEGDNLMLILLLYYLRRLKHLICWN